MSLPSPGILLSRAQHCPEPACDLVFDGAQNDTCPRCGSEGAPVDLSRREAVEQLREDIALVEGSLIQIAYGKFTPEFKQRLAEKSLAYIKKSRNKKAAVAAAAQTNKEVPVQ